MLRVFSVRGVGEEKAAPQPLQFFTSLCALYGCTVTILQLSEFCDNYYNW